MEILLGVEKVREMILKYELPQNEMVVFGVMCPYCGKYDRIRLLDSPEGLEGKVDEDYLRNYSKIWQEIERKQKKLAVCRFCFNVVGLEEENFRAVALY